MKHLILLALIFVWAFSANAHDGRRRWGFFGFGGGSSSYSSSYSGSGISYGSSDGREIPSTILSKMERPPLDTIYSVMKRGTDKYVYYKAYTKKGEVYIDEAWYHQAQAYLDQKAANVAKYAEKPPILNLPMVQNEMIVPWEQDSIPLDGKLVNKVAPWLYKYKGKQASNIYRVMRDDGSKIASHYPIERKWNCGHIVNYLEFDAFDCRFVVLAVDLEAGSMMMKIDMWIKGATDNVLAATYFAEVVGENTDFTLPLMSKLSKSKKLNSLASAINALNYGKVQFFQNHFKIGKITVTPTGSLMINPLRSTELLPLYKKTNGTGNVSYKSDKFWKLPENSEPLIYDFDSTYGLEVQYANIEHLFKSIERTTKVLDQARLKLMAGPIKDDELGIDAVAELEKTIVDNAEIMAEDFRMMRKYINTMNFHPMEVSYFINKVKGLVNSLDEILCDIEHGNGGAPGFMSIIHLN